MPRTARQSTIQLLGALLALGVITLLVWTTTSAAFLDTTVNPGNSFGTGDVVLTDDDNGTAAFTVTDMAPGQVEVACIEVEYDGSITSGLGTVDFYVANLTGTATLGDDINVQVEEGTAASGGTFGDCTGFVPGVTVANDSLTNLDGDVYGDNAGTWVPSSAPETRAYRITVTLSGTPDPASESGSVTADFVWEIQTN